ncbi:MAG: DUF362 domain-containing protein [Bryobacterales bacterium]|nr:DUF362 domain-containing protein [Bryobacterales bacterium]
MNRARRDFLSGLAASAALPLMKSASAAPSNSLGIPGPYRAKVVAVHHPASVISGNYQREPVRQMIRRGLTELTGAPDWQSAFKVFFQPGDVVGIKVNPVGQPYLISSAEVFQELVAGLEAAGVKRKDIVAYDRFRKMFLSGGFDKWLPEGVRWTWASDDIDAMQLDMAGYDPDQYMEMALVLPKADPSNPHHRRSYLANFLAKDVNKMINLGVVKHHQSAGVTIALKNMSHGLVNNVSRSHVSSSNNACGMFIPTVIDMATIRKKAVLHVIDGVLAAYHGGPGSTVRNYIWEHKTMYFGTDPVALDRTGLTVIDDKREQVGMKPIALAYRDKDSNFVRMQPEHIEIAGLLGLGESDESKINLKKITLG